MLGKKFISVIGLTMCLTLVGCGGDKKLTEDLVSLNSDKEVSEDGNYVVVVELRDGISNVSYTLIENGKIIGSDDNIKEAILKENVMQNKKPGEYKYTLSVKDEEDSAVTKEITVEVKDDKKDTDKKESESSDNKETEASKEGNSENLSVSKWDSDSKEYKEGDKVSFKDKTYTCLQGHTSQEAWDPMSVPALWKERK